MRPVKCVDEMIDISRKQTAPTYILIYAFATLLTKTNFPPRCVTIFLVYNHFGPRSARRMQVAVGAEKGIASSKAKNQRITRCLVFIQPSCRSTCGIDFQKDARCEILLLQFSDPWSIDLSITQRLLAVRDSFVIHRLLEMQQQHVHAT